MRSFTSNLYVMGLLLIGLGLGLWYIFTEQSRIDKKSIVDIFTDLLFYFIGTALSLNVLVNLPTIMEVPYQALMVSSNIMTLAAGLLIMYAVYTYGQQLWQAPLKSRGVLQLFTILGLVNHIYLYISYRNGQTILFIVLFILLLFASSIKRVFQKLNLYLLVISTVLVHLLLMQNKPILYFNLSFYSHHIVILMMTFIIALEVQRRKWQSKQN